MLKKGSLFYDIEKYLEENRSFRKDIDRSAKIKGRMLITCGDAPDDLELEIDEVRPYSIFEASFDFCDYTMSIALYMDKIEV
ncbi:hypothetical protein [Companilactobacillus sp. DQM5]|uniref:hypothetical protein n=1 Tax=Companilactobacillus sp. DQM5 TaxID=3463359 RepID=UPI00405978EC